ncbi:Transcription factor 25 [Rhodotorula toruloides]|nr:Transcription factor 25 [Rhodotorula toruloides]
MGRLNKRQQRELAELEELERSRQASTSTLPTQNDITDEEEEEVVAQPKGGFAALGLGDEPDDQDEEEEESTIAAPTKAKSSNRKKKKKAAKPADDSPSAPVSLDSPASPPSVAATPTKSKSKKAKAAKAETPKVEDDGMDEIDRALAELATRGGNAQVTAGSTATSRLDPKWAAVKEVYAFDPKYLDSDAELRRMFGKSVIGSAPQAPRSNLHARFANNPHHATSLRRTSSYLATPEPGWPSPAGVLTLERYEGVEAQEDASGGDWFTFVHSPSYKQAQMMFLEVLQQADGNRLYDVLAAQPYHVDTHMQLSEMMAQQGDQGASSTHLSRALYALSAPLPPTFPSGSFRLAYSQIENRALYLGIARKVALLVKRGTWQTAFEWAKIGLSISGDADPVGMLCWLDLLAPKAGQHEWFFKLIPALEAAYPSMCISGYPGLAYAKALCLRNQEEEKKETGDKSTAALVSAILRFPMVATLLSNALAFDVPPALVSHRRAQPDGSYTKNPSYALSLLSELYANRSAPLWKDPASTAWLRKAVVTAATMLDDQSNEDVKIGEELFSKGPFPEGYAPAGIIRAAFISEIPSVRPYLPPTARSGTFYSFDPLPPTGPNVTHYDDSYFAMLYAAPSFRRRGRGVVPAGLAGRGGGGGTDVAAALRDGLMRMLGMGAEGPQVELNDELRAELLEELAMLNGGGGEMPGGFAGEDEDGEEANRQREMNEDESAEAVRGVFRGLGNYFGFVGPRPGTEGETGAEDGEAEEEWEDERGQ